MLKVRLFGKHLVNLVKHLMQYLTLLSQKCLKNLAMKLKALRRQVCLHLAVQSDVRLDGEQPLHSLMITQLSSLELLCQEIQQNTWQHGLYLHPRMTKLLSCVLLMLLSCLRLVLVVTQRVDYLSTRFLRTSMAVNLALVQLLTQRLTQNMLGILNSTR